MKQLPICILILSMITFVGCSNAVQHQAKSESQTEKLNQIEETDAFVKLVDKHLGYLYKVEKKTTGDGYNERGKGTIAMYFQEDYVIKMEENIVINDTLYEEEHYLYDIKPIYFTQKIIYPNGKIENNKIYLKEWHITHWYQDGKLISEPSKIQTKEKGLTDNFNRFR